MIPLSRITFSERNPYLKGFVFYLSCAYLHGHVFRFIEAMPQHINKIVSLALDPEAYEFLSHLGT